MALRIEPFQKQPILPFLWPQRRVGVPVFEFQFEQVRIIVLQPALEALGVIAGGLINQIDGSFFVDLVKRASFGSAGSASLIQRKAGSLYRRSNTARLINGGPSDV